MRKIHSRVAKAADINEHHVLTFFYVIELFFLIKLPLLQITKMLFFYANVSYRAMSKNRPPARTITGQPQQQQQQKAGAKNIQMKSGVDAANSSSNKNNNRTVFNKNSGFSTSTTTTMTMKTSVPQGTFIHVKFQFLSNLLLAMKVLKVRHRDWLDRRIAALLN